MKCAVIVFIVMAAKWSASETKCEYAYECSGRYKNCCNNKCDYRRFCSNYCSANTDCAPNDYCVYNACSQSKPEGYCNRENSCTHYLESCVNNKCEYCNCKSDEKCVEGKCEKKSKSFSPASIAGLAAVVVIGSCIACGIYCGCARRRQPQQQLQQQQQLSARDLAALDESSAVETGGGVSSQPIHPGGPPPYHSLERIDRIEELPPPTYEEAVRNSKNNLNAV